MRSLLKILLLVSLCVSAARAQIPGPYYPPPQGTLSYSASPTNDGAIGLSPGETWSFSDITMAASAPLFWGVSNNGVAFSMASPSFNSSEIMTYQAGLSSPANGQFVWQGQTVLRNIQGVGQTVYTRFVVTITNLGGAPAVVFATPAAFGLSTNVGTLVTVNSANVGFSVNMLFEASFTYGSGYEPALTFFNSNPHQEGSAYSSVTGGFYVSSPPQLQVNGPLTVLQGGGGVITSNLLDTTSTLVGPGQLTYTIASGTNGGTTYNGTLYLNGNPLTNGSTFLQSDINAGSLSYTNGGSCATNDDFEFSVSDPYGEVIPTGQYTTYSFPIYIQTVHYPPLAINSAIVVPVGGSNGATLSASNLNCLPVTLTYSIVTNPAKGTVTLNPTTGAYTYTAAFLQIGADSFSFQVYDGTSYAAAPGVVSVDIVRVPPVANPGGAIATENTPLAGMFSATDPNKPPQPLTFSILTNGAFGTAVITSASSGGFVYTPNSNAFGQDVIYFAASQGTNVSAPAAFTITIRPTLDAGHLLITDQKDASIVEFDPVNNYRSVVTSSNLLAGPVSIVIEPAGTFIVGDESGGLVRVNHATGAQTQLASKTNFTGPLGAPTGLAIDPAGGILAADLSARIQRFDPVTGTASNVTSGGILSAAFGLAVGANREIYVTDAGAFIGATSKLLQVDPNTGAQTLLLTNGLKLPTGIAATASNTLYFCDSGSFLGGSDSIDQFNLNNLSGGVWLTNAPLATPFGIALGLNQVLYISENRSNPNLLGVIPGTNAFLVFSPGVGQPFGLAAAVEAPEFIAPKILPGNGFDTAIESEVGRFVAVQYSSNLLNWQYSAGIPVLSNTVTFIDSTTNAAARFYRAFTY